MSYIIFDLEFNQGRNSMNTDAVASNADCPFEIIQIGAVKLDNNLSTISTFNKLIKPSIYTSLHPIIRDMTLITMERLESAEVFESIYSEFIQFITSKDDILCVWGAADIKELFRNAKFHNLDTNLIPPKYINLQSYVSKLMNSPKGINVGLKTAVELLNIPIKKPFHDAYNDAYYTAEVFKKVFNSKIKINIYSPNINLNRNKNVSIKQKVNYNKLITQFEKMYNRPMTEEEISMIKLAYNMGKTNQFTSTVYGKKDE